MKYAGFYADKDGKDWRDAFVVEETDHGYIAKRYPEKVRNWMREHYPVGKLFFINALPAYYNFEDPDLNQSITGLVRKIQEWYDGLKDVHNNSKAKRKEYEKKDRRRYTTSVDFTKRGEDGKFFYWFSDRYETGTPSAPVQQPTPQPVPEPVPVPQPVQQAPAPQPVKQERTKREQRHWLLSTNRTLAWFDIKGYYGKTFDYDRHWNRSNREQKLLIVFNRIFHDVIIPNALVAKAYGKDVELKDALAALRFVRSQNGMENAWNEFYSKMGAEWLQKNMKDPFEFYVHDVNREGTKLPPDKWTTLERYLENPSVYKFTRENKQAIPSKVKTIVDAFLEHREIGTWTYERIMYEFDVSRDTVSKFFSMLNERRKNGIQDYDNVGF